MKNWKQRTGVWVETNAGVGLRMSETVLVGADGSRRLVNSTAVPAEGETLDSEWWIHLTNVDGSTLTQIPESVTGEVKLARAASIPAARVGHLTVEQLAVLGYE